MGRRSFLERLRTAGLLLALFALTFKALLPPGYMLSTDADNRVVVTLCMGGEMVLDLGDDAPAQDQSSAHCPFAFTSAPALAPPPAVEAAQSFAVLSVDAPPERAGASDHDATGPPLPARGPPTHA
jgi:hypothetical protein